MVSGRSSRKSSISHSGPYGAAVMTSLSWFSGNSASSWKYMVMLRSVSSGKCCGREVSEWSEGLVAQDSGAFHLADCGPVVLHRVVLGGSVVPDRDAVLGPAPAHLVLRDRGLARQVPQQVAGSGGVVDA